MPISVPTFKIKIVPAPTLKMKSLPALTTRVTATGGLQATKENGVVTIEPAYDDLAIKPSVPEDERPHVFMPALDTLTGQHVRISVETFIQGFATSLVAIGELDPAADTFPYFTSAEDAALAPITSFGRSLVDDANAATARTTLGLGATDNVAFGQTLSVGGGVSTADVVVAVGNTRTGSGNAIVNLYSDNTGSPTAQITRFSGATNILQITNLSTDPIRFAVNGTEQGQVTTSGLLAKASGYYNFSSAGSSGYGIRDNSGTVQFKNSGGDWFDIPIVSEVHAARYGVSSASSDNKAAIEAAAAAAIAAGAKLVLPGGRLECDSAISISLTGSQVLCIEGQGQEETVLYFPNANSGISVSFAAGGWWTRDPNGNAFWLEKLALVTNQVGVGTAVTIDGNGVAGRPQPVSGARDVTIRGNTTQTGWSQGILFDACYGTVVDNVAWFGDQTPGNVGDAFVYQNSGTDEGAQHYLLNVQANFANKVVNIVGETGGGGVEGVHIVNINAVNVNYGVYWDNTSGGFEPLLEITNAHMNIYATGAGVLAVGVAMVQVTNSNISLQGAATGIFLDESRRVTIVGNTIEGSSASAIGIDVRNSGGTASIYDDNPNTIDVNSFIGTLGNGIILRANTARTYVGAGNVFSTSVVTPISNLGTNNYTVTNGWSTLAFSGGITLGTPLGVASGGSGAPTLTGLLQGNGTGAFTAITNSTTVGQVLRVTGSNTYAWGALNLADTDAVTGQLPAANVVTGTSGAAIPLLNGNNTQSGSFTVTGAFSATGSTITIGDAVTDVMSIHSETNFKTLTGTGAGAWFDGNVTTKRLFMGMSAASDTTFRYFGAALAADLFTIDLSTGVMTQVNGGFVVGAATGGAKGTGSINVAADIYKNNVAYTNPDYVFEHAFTGNIMKLANSPGAEKYRGLVPLDLLGDHVRATYRLPGDPEERRGIFDRADFALEKIEEAHLYIIELHERIRRLERSPTQ